MIILRIFAHVMSRCDLDLWPLDFKLSQHFDCHAFKQSTKIERNRIFHGWVIDDLARLQFYEVEQNGQSFLRGALTQLYQTWLGHRAIVAALHFCIRIRISCCIFKHGWLEIVWCWKRRQVSHFLIYVKNKGGVGEIFVPIVEALPTTELDSWICRTGICRTGKWRTKSQGWNLQDWKMTDWKSKT